MGEHSTRSVKEIFADAAELPEDQRAAFLDRECAGDAARRSRVSELLAALAKGGSFMNMPTSNANAESPTLDSSPLREGPGTRIGPYKLLQLIGEGGFGSVFMAEQQKPVSRKVALKIIKLGMDTRQVIARFEAERQALAMMDHPNIARVLDAGATETGRPFFVMELVKGDPIVEYSDKNNLSIRERLELFAQVCTAVQHAHTKGIIHRDIKSSNILVNTQDGRPNTKVIDFGIAKATASKLTEKTLFTEHKALIGTPEYMSPEQAEGSLDIDTRTDVYSLGVLLYELLTGTTPFGSKELRSAAYAEIQRIIREVEPPKPSTRISQNTDTIASIATKRHTEPKRLGTIVRGELDWIVMKALEKDRQRRYETANGLGMDIRRYLSGEAVVAAPPSTAYWFKKFVGRNKGPVTAACMIAAALTLGMVGIAWQARIASQRATAADEAQKRAEAVNKFMFDALQSADPYSGGKQDALVSEVMMKAVVDLDAGVFKEDPWVEASLRGLIGTVLVGNGRAAEAEPQILQSLNVCRRLHPGDHVSTGAMLHNLAFTLQSLGRLTEAEELFAQSLGMMQRLRSGDDSDVAASMDSLAIVRKELGRFAEAKDMCVRALEMRRRLYPSPMDHKDVADSTNSLGRIKIQIGQAEEAEGLFMQALEMRKRLHKGDHPDIAWSLENVAFAREKLGRSVEAEPLFVRALDMRRRLFKGDHPDIATGLTNLAHVRLDLGRAAEAEPLYIQALDMRRRLYNGDHPEVARSLGNMAYLRREAGREAEAEPLYVQSLEMYQRLFKGDHPDVAGALNSIASVRSMLGRPAEAEPLFVRSLEMYQRIFRGDHPSVANSLHSLATVRGLLGREAEAEALYVQSLEMYQRLFKGDHPDIARGLTNLSFMRLSLGRAAEAEPLAVQSLEMCRRLFRGDHQFVAMSLNTLASVRELLGRAAEAEQLSVQALEMCQRLFKDDHPEAAWSLNNLASARESLGRLSEAEPLYRQSLEMRMRLHQGDHPDAATSRSNLAHTHQALGRSVEARQGFDEALAMLRRLTPNGSATLARTLWRSGSARLENKDAAAALPELQEAVSMGEKVLSADHPQLKEYRETLAKCKAAIAEQGKGDAKVGGG